jgi:hypothetical protein
VVPLRETQRAHPAGPGTYMRIFTNRDWFIAPLLIVFLALIGYGFLLWPGKIPYTPYSDIVTYHLSTKEVLHRSLQAGQGFPFWRADQVAGGPALTNPNALYTYPLHGLFYVLSPAAAMGWTIWIHLVIGALVYYALGHSLGLGWWPRLLMAVAALFNFKVLMAVYAGWLSVLTSITLFPLLFLVIFRVVKSPGSGSALAVAASGALCLHTGHLQLVYYSGLLLIAYLLVTLGGFWRAGRRQEVRQAIGWLVCGGVLAIGMAAYLLLPLAAEAPLISRGLASDEFFRAEHSLGLRHLLTLFSPLALGTPLDGSYPGVELWEDVAYFGLLPLLLACVGAVLGWHRPQARFLVVGFAVSLLLALDTPLVHLPYEFLPGFRWFRLPGRMFFLMAFFGIALAGIGLEALLDRLRKRHAGTWGPALATAGVILVIAGEGTTYAHQHIGMVKQVEAMPATDYGRFLAEDRTLFRIAPVGRYTVSYGWGAAMRLQSVSGYEPFTLRHYQQYFNVLQSGRARREDAIVWTDLLRVARWDLLDALNVKYVLAPFPLQLPADQFKFVGQYHDQPVFVISKGVERIDVFIYRNKTALPRAFWTERVVRVVADDMRNTLQHGDIRSLAVIQGIGPEEATPGLPNDQVKVVGAADGYLSLETVSGAKRFLVISEIWHPGWSASLDGRALPLHRADLALMGAWIPAGTHRLVLAFRPLHWRLALGISLCCGAVFLLWVAVHLFRTWGPAPGAQTG